MAGIFIIPHVTSQYVCVVCVCVVCVCVCVCVFCVCVVCVCGNFVGKVEMQGLLKQS